jgi:hypothetical protein
MYTKLLQYTASAGWSEPAPPGWDGERTIGLVFAAPHYIDDPQPLLSLTRAMPQVRWLGCSSAGEIGGAHLADGSIQVCMIRLERSDARLVSAPIAAADRGRATGLQLAHALSDPSLRGVIVLSDGLQISGADLASGLVSALGDAIPITGGLAGDGLALARTWVLVDGAPRTGFVSALGLYGDAIHITSSACGGWAPFGPTRRITRSRHNVLYELDGRPALTLYKEYLGELAAELPASGIRFPLEISQDQGHTNLIRTVIGVDEVERSITFTGDVPEGATARLMRATVERLLDGAQEAYDALAAPDLTGPACALAISCVGRRVAMGQRADEELDGVTSLGAGVAQIGFYSYGELSPAQAGAGGCALHNQTMTLTMLREGQDLG